MSFPPDPVPTKLSDKDDESWEYTETPAGGSDSFHFFETLLDASEEAHPGSKKFYNLLIEAGLLHSQKQKDYGRPEDPFANVRASEDFGVPGWVGCMIRANDKIRRLQTYAKTGQLANEGVKDSFIDLAVYSLIGAVLFEEEANTSSVDIT
jgi:hypothetical protein